MEADQAQEGGHRLASRVVWTKVIREITVAAKAGGGDPGGNPRLRTRDRRARRRSTCRSENIERAIKKGTGELEGAQYEELTYEGYGPGGAAILIEATTDNANRTVAEIRHAFSRNGGNLGATEFGGLDVRPQGPDLHRRREVRRGQGTGGRARGGRRRLRARGRPVRRVHHAVTVHAVRTRSRDEASRSNPPSWRMVPKNTVKVEGADAERMLKLMEVLEELDDVSKVFSNFDIDASQLAEAEA